MKELESYADKYQTIRMERRNGILQITFHTDGGSLLWNDTPHQEFGYAFADIASDPENKVVIMTGTGEDFCAGWGGPRPVRRAPRDWDPVYWEGKRLLMNLLEIEVPIISAVNSPATYHAEIALLCDIVLAAGERRFSGCAPFPPRHRSRGWSAFGVAIAAGYEPEQILAVERTGTLCA